MNLEGHFALHDAGRGAHWTQVKKPVKLVYAETHLSERCAIHRERQIKKWSHAKKVALIDGDSEHLHELAKSHD
jgi:predicted GIY-YIG superfamily endonuclease